MQNRPCLLYGHGVEVSAYTAFQLCFDVMFVIIFVFTRTIFNVNLYNIYIYAPSTRAEYIVEIHHEITIVYLSDIFKKSTLGGCQLSQVALPSFNHLITFDII